MIDSKQDEAVKPEACPEKPVEWRCFHCGDVFTLERCARLHFGRDEGATPACIIKGAEGGLLRALRDAEEQADEAIQAIHAESTDAAKAFHRQRCRHTRALIAAEESGYEKGLADGRTLPSNDTFADDRNGVEGEKLAGMLAEMDRLGKCGKYDAFQSTIEPERWYVGRGKMARFATEIGASGQMEAELVAEALNALPALLAALSRTPSSPQADEADVERVARAICAANGIDPAEPVQAGGIAWAAWQEWDDEARAAIATMTTRPAGGEEVARG